MIINPIVAAAAVAARAVGTIFPGDWMDRRSSRHDVYYQQRHQHDDEPFRFRNEAPITDRQYIESDLYEQSREFDAFTMTHTTFIFQDAEILSKETIKPDGNSNPPPPPLPNTNNPWELLGIDTSATFDDVRRAYRRMTKMYHPDAVAGPDATADERRNANEDFARINAAFEFIKRKDSEEVYEYIMYVDGERVTRSVVVASGESQQMDPYRINYDRIIDMSDYTTHRPKTKMWYEAENDYHQMHNGFASYSGDAHSKGKWWHSNGFAQRNDDVGTIPSKEIMWNRRIDAEQQDARHCGGVGFNPSQDRWWDERTSFDHKGPSNNHDCQVRNNNKFRRTKKHGYPYKDMVWNEFDSSAEVSHNPSDTVEFDYDHQENHLPRDKWWKGNEIISGEFSP
ncbi:hypothetical protein ACHAXH_001466 [Discostella pseudostelligera]